MTRTGCGPRLNLKEPTRASKGSSAPCRSSLLTNRTRSGLASGLEILEHLGGRRNGATLTDIARAIGMSKSGVHSLLAILTERRFVGRDSGGAYRLGLRAWEIGAATPQLELCRVAEPHMQRLMRDVNESTILAMRDGSSAIAIHLVEGHQTVRVHERVGERTPLHCTSTGLALLAAMSDDEAAEALPDPLVAVTPDTIADPSAVIQELRNIRQRGYAINLGGWRSDVAGASALVPSCGAPSRVALCVAAPRYRVTSDWFDRICPALMDATRRIADDMPADGELRRSR